MIALYVITGLLTGTLLTALVLRARQRELESRLVSITADTERALSERDEARADAAGLRAQLSTDQQEAFAAVKELGEELSQTKVQLAEVTATLESERAAHEERIAELRELDDRIKGHLKSATADALKDTTPHLVELAKAQLGKERAEGRSELDKKHQRVELLVGNIDKALGQVRGKLEEIEKDRLSAREQLGAQLEQMRVSQNELMAGTQALVGALGRPHVRGRWGEVQLRNIIEAAGMLPHVEFDEQPSLPSDEGLLRPDARVKMPGGRFVVIDAKVPLASYLEWCSETDPAKQAELMNEHVRHVRTHLTALDSKAYWERIDGSPDFVVMFIPNDQVLLAAMSADKTLAEEVQRRNVVIATPMNLMALLRTIAVGWRHEKLAANAQEVETLGRELHKRLGVFARHLAGLGKKIGTLVKGYNDTVGSFERSVLPGARRFSELGAVAPDASLEALPGVTQLPRELPVSDQPPSAEIVESISLNSDNEDPFGSSEDNDDNENGGAISAA